MDKIKYSQKEIDIFNGLIGLMKEGVNPYLIKVSDIARAANIGKGTIYDYFSSKEDVISKAIIYGIKEEVRLITKKVRTKENFKDRFYEILNIMENNFKKKLSILNILLSSGGIEKFYESLVNKENKISDFMVLINQEIKDLLDLGHKEGLIRAGERPYYEISAVLGAISSFSNYFNHRYIYRDVSPQEAKDTAYEILIRSLN